MHFQFDLLQEEHVGDRFLVVDGHHSSEIQPYVWPILLALSPYLDANEGTGLPRTSLLD